MPTRHIFLGHNLDVVIEAVSFKMSCNVIISHFFCTQRNCSFLEVNRMSYPVNFTFK